jgi:hypothetical protein
LKLPSPDNQLQIKRNSQAITLLLASRVNSLPKNLGKEERKKELSVDKEAQVMVKNPDAREESPESQENTENPENPEREVMIVLEEKTDPTVKSAEEKEEEVETETND